MAAITPVLGKIGFRHVQKLTIANGTKVITSSFTPADTDLHDISSEGILINHIRIAFMSTPNAGDNFAFGIFNKTSGLTPYSTPEAAAWATRMKFTFYTAAGFQFIPELTYDLSGYPGGGVGLIGDFISLAFESSANVAPAMDFLLTFNYDWVKIDSESYRRILYARSI
jgi:hypothetical protein